MQSSINLLLVLAHGLQPLLPTLLHRRPSLQALIPSPASRILLLPLLWKVLTHDLRLVQDQPVPRHEAQIRIADAVATEVGLLRLRQVGVDNAEDAADLITVAVQAAREVLFGVVEEEPGALTEVGALAGHFCEGQVSGCMI